MVIVSAGQLQVPITHTAAPVADMAPRTECTVVAREVWGAVLEGVDTLQVVKNLPLTRLVTEMAASADTMLLKEDQNVLTALTNDYI